MTVKWYGRKQSYMFQDNTINLKGSSGGRGSPIWTNQGAVFILYREESGRRIPMLIDEADRLLDALIQYVDSSLAGKVDHIGWQYNNDYQKRRVIKHDLIDGNGRPPYN
ncbi:MAG: hypothetical protein F4W95_10565 [Chloroflexi bacterium]|nr:hypothetical protein [Chloroflexota bacterium]